MIHDDIDTSERSPPTPQKITIHFQIELEVISFFKSILCILV